MAVSLSLVKSLQQLAPQPRALYSDIILPLTQHSLQAPPQHPLATLRRAGNDHAFGRGDGIGCPEYLS